MKTQGEIEAAICKGVGRFEQEYMGRGPKDIHAHLIGDLLVVRLQGVLTADDAEIRVMPPKEPLYAEEAEVPLKDRPGKTVTVLDPRIPAPGTAITRKYKGRVHQVVVLNDGFEYEGHRYRTLTAVVRAGIKEDRLLF